MLDLAPNEYCQMVKAAEPKVTEFRAGERVMYMPRHAKGDCAHPDNEFGRVVRYNADRSLVFVQYDGDSVIKSTRPEDLRRA